jgi:hypothetical protein
VPLSSAGDRTRRASPEPKTPSRRSGETSDHEGENLVDRPYRSSSSRLTLHFSLFTHFRPARRRHTGTNDHRLLDR